MSKDNYFLGFFNNHIFQHYRKGGLKAFCEKNNISYSSTKKIMTGQVDAYPGVVLKIKEALKNELAEFECFFPERFLENRKII